MSLVAALLIGSSAFAIENTKVSGDVNVYYNTNDAKPASSLNGVDGSLFDADSSAADISLNLNLTTDLIKNDTVSVSAGAGATALATLGLENNLVHNVWGGAHGATANNSDFGNKVDNAFWMNEAWIAATTGKTTLKLGRMELDTPLAFTEKWSIEKNTFEAIVLINQDIPDTTLVGAYIGNGNGNETFGASDANTVQDANLTVAATVNEGGEFETYGSNGAYAVGAINNSFKPLTLQAWYYNVQKVVEAYWLQADLKMAGVMVGAQYSGHTLSKSANIGGAALNVSNPAITSDISSDVYAFMLGYQMKDTFTAKVAYSQVDKDFAAGFNTATNYEHADSKLYTQPWWSRGYVTQADTESYKVCVSSPVNGIVDLGVHYSNADQSDTAGDNDLQEVTLTAGKTFGPLDATLVYSNIDANNQNDGSSYNQIQAYLTLNF